MNKRYRTYLLIFTSFFVSIFFYIHKTKVGIVRAETEQEKIERLSQEIKEYEVELDRLKSQASTLSNQIAQYDAQIRLTTLKINQTEEKILLLGSRITQLEGSLQALTKAFSSRVVESYKITRLHEPFLMLVTSPSLKSAFTSYRYLEKIQESDTSLMLRLENAQVSYQEEKVNQEDLQEQLNDQKSVLGAQKSAKANLLEQTRNNEKKYQQLLAQAKAEFEAIQAIIAGKGVEEEVGEVSAGEKIASIIQGPSCNSSGQHLHFIVSQSGAAFNPFSFLRSGVSYDNCSGSSCGSGDGDSFNPSGSWDWPISDPIKFTQGFGSTWAVRNTWVGRIYSSHNGIDIDSKSNPEVKAVQAGTLFRGSFTGSNGCRLRYVRVDHKDSEIDTFYLHINY